MNLSRNHIQFIRHATFILHYNGLQLLIDPMLSAKDAFDPVPNAAISARIPMVNLPFTDEKIQALVNAVDSVVVTHTHPDHWDIAAQRMINKDLPIFCQPVDKELITSQGFTNVTAIHTTIDWQGLTITRTGGQHGTGDIGKAMGEVSGFVFQESQNKQTVYITGDTIWCDEVASALTTYQPNIIVVNTGSPQFLEGDPICMTKEDVCTVCANTPPASIIIATHLETINHCLLTRAELQQEVNDKGFGNKVIIPADGMMIPL